MAQRLEIIAPFLVPLDEDLFHNFQIVRWETQSQKASGFRGPDEEQPKVDQDYMRVRCHYIINVFGQASQPT